MKHIRNLLGPKVLLVSSLLYTLILTKVSLSEMTEFPEVELFDWQDKFAHVIAYILLAVLWALYGLYTVKENSQKYFFWTLLGLLLIYGIVIEVLQQATTSTRTADVWDIFANVIGAVLGVFVAKNGYQKWLAIKK